MKTLGKSLVRTNTMPLLEMNGVSNDTYHDALDGNPILTDSIGQLARWSLCQSEYEFIVAHRSDIKHLVDDALSSLRTTGENQTHHDLDLHVVAIDEKKEHVIHVLNTNESERTPLRATEKTPLDKTHVRGAKP